MIVKIGRDKEEAKLNSWVECDRDGNIVAALYGNRSASVTLSMKDIARLVAAAAPISAKHREEFFYILRSDVERYSPERKESLF